MANKEFMSKEQAHILLLYLLKQLNLVCESANIPYYACGGTCLGIVRHNSFIPWDDDIDVLMPREYYYDFVEASNKQLKSPVVIRTRENDPYFCCEYIKICFKDDVLGYSDLALDVFFLDETNPKRKLLRAIQNRVITDLYFIKKYKVSRTGNGDRYIPKNPFKHLYLYFLSSILSFNTIEKVHKKMMLAEKEVCKYWVNWGSCYSYKKDTFFKKDFGFPQKTRFENTYIYMPEKPEKILSRTYGKDFIIPPPPEKRVDHGVGKLNCKELNFEKIKNEIGL